MEKSVRTSDDFGPIIRDLRLKLHLTQVELSERVGIKQATLSSIERGSKNAEMKTIFAILSGLNMELTVRPRVKRPAGYAPGSK